VHVHCTTPQVAIAAWFDNPQQFQSAGRNRKASGPRFDLAAATAVFEELKEPHKGHIGVDGFIALSDRLGRGEWGGGEK
jgi:hypothetical protein